MDNTTKNKEKFFAQYWGQKVACFNLGKSTVSQMTIGFDNQFTSLCKQESYGFSNSFLKLKSVSLITDQQAIELCKKAYPLAFEDDKLKWKIERDNEVGFLTVRSKLSWFSFSFSFETGRIFLYDADDLSNNFVDHYACYKYLIEQGFYLGEGEEIEYGWVKLKELEG